MVRVRATPVRAAALTYTTLPCCCYPASLPACADRIRGILEGRREIALFPAGTGEGEGAIFTYIRENDIERMRGMFGRRDLPVDVAERSTMTTGLMRCAALGRLEILRMFLEAGANVNVRSDTGNTALHYAFDFWSHIDMARPIARKMGTERLNAVVAQLLKHGADPTIRNVSGELPLHSAARLNLDISVERLLAAGSPIDAVRGKDGKTAAQLAQEAGAKQALAVLLNWRRIRKERVLMPATKFLADMADHAARDRKHLTATGHHLPAFDIAHDTIDSALLKPPGAIDMRAAAAAAAAAGAGGAGASGAAAAAAASGGGGGDGDGMAVEYGMPVEDLLKRWHLHSKWMEHKRQVREADAKAAGDRGDGTGKPTGDAAVVAAEYDMTHGKLKAVNSALVAAEKWTAGKVGHVAQARRLLTTGETGSSTTWLAFGDTGKEMLAKRKAEAIDEVDSEVRRGWGGRGAGGPAAEGRWWHALRRGVRVRLPPPGCSVARRSSRPPSPCCCCCIWPPLSPLPTPCCCCRTT